ncbi:MAG TPA: LPS export ABC transporter periplasmic protein LptC [Vicinamibacterales bacterium]|jgi:LPS export ABC transporter protein LptC|nr:LPS export ABC transporter periplasmic protein LptC [Vicinamibacterales bacterium]
MSWHKPVRLGVGLFGLVAAVGVYFAIGSRQAAPTAPPDGRLDPNAILETAAAVVQQSRESEEDFQVTADRTLSYEDGTAKLMGVHISVKRRGGRDYLVTAKEAGAGKDRKDLALKGSVVLEASDGFKLTTDDATFEDATGMVKAPARVSFTKGGLSGSGRGMTYDRKNDVLTLLAEPDVTMAGTESSAATSFKAGGAVLDRLMDVLVLSGGGHAQRGEQTFDAETITARLGADEDYVRSIEMRGNARVAGGGGALDAMSAQAIDLSYVEGGDILDRVTLTGNAAAALTGKKKDAGTAQGGARQLVGGALDMQLAADGTLVHASGHDGIRFDLPGTDKARPSSVQAKTFDANGTEGAGLTSVAFVDDVVFREVGQNGAATRAARSRTLDLSLDHDEVTSAMFRGSVAFEDRGLAACAAQVRYSPGAGSLSLSGADAGGGPRASDDEVAIAAESIDVVLQNTEIDARRTVKTVLRPTREARGTCLPRVEAAKTGATESKLPGLLKQNAPIYVNADRLGYAGAGGAATYTGNASLLQGETSIRADELRLDQSKGDLTASGSARATLILGGKSSIGRAEEIRYEDATHVVSYESRRPPARGRGTGRATGAPAAPPSSASRGAPVPRGAVPAGPTQAYLFGPQGELRAWRIAMALTSDAGKADRLEAYDNVILKVETKHATGERLTYFAEDERYVITGTAVAPVCLVDPNRATTGRTLVYFRATDKILVDGNEETRTQTKSGGACATSPAR